MIPGALTPPASYTFSLHKKGLHQTFKDYVSNIKKPPPKQTIFIISLLRLYSKNVKEIRMRNKNPVYRYPKCLKKIRKESPETGQKFGSDEVVVTRISWTNDYVISERERRPPFSMAL